MKAMIKSFGIASLVVASVLLSGVSWADDSSSDSASSQLGQQSEASPICKQCQLRAAMLAAKNEAVSGSGSIGGPEGKASTIDSAK